MIAVTPVLLKQQPLEELLLEAKRIIDNRPPIKSRTRKEIDACLVDNFEVLLEIRKEQSKRKNANMANSDLMNSIYDFERNLVKLTRSLPPSLIADLDILKKHKGLLHYNTNIKKALLLPPVINQQQQQQQQQPQLPKPSIPSSMPYGPQGVIQQVPSTQLPAGIVQPQQVMQAGMPNQQQPMQINHHQQQQQQQQQQSQQQHLIHQKGYQGPVGGQPQQMIGQQKVYQQQQAPLPHNGVSTGLQQQQQQQQQPPHPSANTGLQQHHSGYQHN